eukprot:5018973-Amphidinium_carterae.1
MTFGFYFLSIHSLLLSSSFLLPFLSSLLLLLAADVGWCLNPDTIIANARETALPEHYSYIAVTRTVLTIANLKTSNKGCEQQVNLYVVPRSTATLQS